MHDCSYLIEHDRTSPQHVRKLGEGPPYQRWDPPES